MSHKKINIVQLCALALSAIAMSPQGEEKDLQEWADATSASMPQSIFEFLYDERLIDKNGTPTSAGMKLLLNGCSFTPNFKMLAEGDFSTAVKMMFEGHKALEEKVAKSESGQIMPKKNADGTWVDTRMCDSLLSLQGWISEVTSDYTKSLKPVKAVKAAKATV